MFKKKKIEKQVKKRKRKKRVKQPHVVVVVVGFFFFSLYLYYYLRGFSCLDKTFFWFQNTPILLSLSRDKIEEQIIKNTFPTPTKTLLTKQDNFPVSFQIVLST